MAREMQDEGRTALAPGDVLPFERGAKNEQNGVYEVFRMSTLGHVTLSRQMVLRSQLDSIAHKHCQC